MSAYARSALLLASAPHRRQQRRNGKKESQQPRRRQGAHRQSSTRRGSGNAGSSTATPQMSGLMSPLLLPQVAPPPRRGGSGNATRRGAASVGANRSNDAAVRSTGTAGRGEEDSAMMEGSETQLNSVAPPLPQLLPAAQHRHPPPPHPQTLGQAHQHMPPPNTASNTNGHPPQTVQVAMMTAPSTRGPSYAVNNGGYQAPLSHNDQQHHPLRGYGASTTTMANEFPVNGSSINPHNQNQQQTNTNFNRDAGHSQQYFQQPVNQQQQHPVNHQQQQQLQQQQQPTAYATTFSQMSELDMSVTQMPPPPPPPRPPRLQQTVQSKPPLSQATSSSSGASISASSKRSGGANANANTKNKRARRGVPPRERPWMSKCMDVVTRPVRNGVKRAIRPWVDRAMGAMMLSHPYGSIQQPRRVGAGAAARSERSVVQRQQQPPRKGGGPGSDAGGEVVAGSGGGGAATARVSNGGGGKGATIEASGAVGGSGPSKTKTSNTSKHAARDQHEEDAVGGESAHTDPPSAVADSSGVERGCADEPATSSTTKRHEGRESSGMPEKRKPSSRMQETWSSSSDGCSSDSSDSDGTEYDFDWKREQSRRKSKRGSRNERRCQDHRGRRTDRPLGTDTRKEGSGRAGIGGKGEIHHPSEDEKNGQGAETGDLIEDSLSNLQPQPRSGNGGRGKYDKQGMEFSVPLLDIPTKFTDPSNEDAATAPEARNGCDGNFLQKPGQAAEVGTNSPGTIAACNTRIEGTTMAYKETEDENQCEKEPKRETSNFDRLRPDRIGSKDMTQTPAALLKADDDDDDAADKCCSYTMTCDDHRREKCEDNVAVANKSSGKGTSTDENNTSHNRNVENDVIDLMSSSTEESATRHRCPPIARVRAECQVQAKPHKVSTTIDVSMDEREHTSRKAACTNTENSISLSTTPVESGRAPAPPRSSSSLQPLPLSRSRTPQKEQERISFPRTKKVDVKPSGYSCGNAQATSAKKDDSILDIHSTRNDDSPLQGSICHQYDRNTLLGVPAAQISSRCVNDQRDMHAGDEQRCGASVEKGIGSTPYPGAKNNFLAIEANHRSSKQESSQLVPSSVSAAKPVATAAFVVQEANVKPTDEAKTRRDIAKAQEHPNITADMAKLEQTFTEVISQVATKRSGRESLLPSEIQGGENVRGSADPSVVLLGLIQGTVTKMVETLLKDAKQEFVSAMKEHLSVSQAPVSAPASVHLQLEPQEDPTQTNQRHTQQSDKKQRDDSYDAAIDKTDPVESSGHIDAAINKVKAPLCDGGVILGAEPSAPPNSLLQHQSHSQTQEFSSAGISSLTFDYCLPSQQLFTANASHDNCAKADEVAVVCSKAACDSGTKRGIASGKVNQEGEGDPGQVQNTANKQPRKVMFPEANVQAVTGNVHRDELQRQCNLQNNVGHGSQNVEAGTYPRSCKTPNFDCCKQSGSTADLKLGRTEAEDTAEKAAVDSHQYALSMYSPKLYSLHDPGNRVSCAQRNALNDGGNTKQHSNELLSGNASDSPFVFDNIVVPETEQQLDDAAPLPSSGKQQDLDNSPIDTCSKERDDASEKGGDDKENVSPIQEEGNTIRHGDDGHSPRSVLVSRKTPKEESRVSNQCSALKRRRRARGRKRSPINRDDFVDKDETFRFGDNQMPLPLDTGTSRSIPEASKAKTSDRNAKKSTKTRKRSTYSGGRTPDIPRLVDVANQPQTKKLQARGHAKRRRHYTS